MSAVLIVLLSGKGSPGVTTAGLALAATWPAASSTPGQLRSSRGSGSVPGTRAVSEPSTSSESVTPLLVECDPAGGDLLTRYRLAGEPGLVSLAAAARRDADPGVLWRHTQLLPGGLPVVVAPAGVDQAGAAAQMLLDSTALTAAATPAARTAAPAMAGSDPPSAPDPRPGPEPGSVIVDVGRLPTRWEQDSGLRRLLGAADRVLLVARNDPDGLVHAGNRVNALRGAAAGLRLLLVGQTYSAQEVAATLAVPVAGVLPLDARAAAALAGRPVRRPKALARSPLLSAATRIAAHLAAELDAGKTVQRSGGDRARRGPEDPAAPQARRGLAALMTTRDTSGHTTARPSGQPADEPPEVDSAAATGDPGHRHAAARSSWLDPQAWATAGTDGLGDGPDASLWHRGTR